jgi:hypothetical protein
LGSGILKILFSPQFLHNNVFYIVVFVGYACQPVAGALLWGSIVGDTSVVDYPNVAFFLTDLPSVHGYLSVARGTTWPLVVSFLSAVSCEVTRLSAEEACEDFPLSVLLDGSSLVSSLSTSSYTLFVSVSSWKEIICFSYLGTRSSWGGVHCIWISLRVPPLIIEWLPGIGGGWPLCFKVIGPIPHMDVDLLLVDRR